VNKEKKQPPTHQNLKRDHQTSLFVELSNRLRVQIVGIDDKGQLLACVLGPVTDHAKRFGNVTDVIL